MHPTLPNRKAIVVIITILIFFLFQAKLSQASFTIKDEKKLGKEFYEKLNSKNALVKDPKINDYINKLGNKILEQSKKSPFDFTFSVIKSSGINAFATPGGFVYVYSGLMTLTENESQLAGVLAHEIAHVNARHIAQSIEKAQKINLATLTAILAGAFLGGKEASAITTLSIATASSLNLKYSRENEEEADRLGMQYLVSAGYDGKAMLDFLKIMRQHEFYSNSIPSYFLTHPGTNDRIRYLDGLLQIIRIKEGSEHIIGSFEIIKTKLILDQKDDAECLKYFQNQATKNPDDVEALHGLAIVHGKLGNVSESLKFFSKALELSPADSGILRDMGTTCFNAGNVKEAITILEKAYAIDKEDDKILLYLGRSYESIGCNESALNFYKKSQNNNTNDPSIYYHLGMVYGKIKNIGESHYNFGIFFRKKHKEDSALFHFKKALACFPAQSEMYKKINKEIDSIHPDPHSKKTKPKKENKSRLAPACRLFHK